MATIETKARSKPTKKEAAPREAAPKEVSLPEESLPKIPACPGIEDLGDRVSFLGVEVMKGKGGPRTPSIARFERNSLTEWDLEFMQKIAISLALRDPILIEAGSGVGKSTGVERMCAYLNMPCFYANCAEYDLEVLMGSRTIAKDGSVEWRDGIIPNWARNGGVLFLDEYNFMRANVRGRLHEVLDSIIRETGKISLTENYDEIISLHPDCRIVAAQNEPGGGNAGREVLDAAQITRFVYIKELEELPRDLKVARALGSINGELYTPKPSPTLYLRTQEVPVPLKDIPGIKELVVRFIEFDAAMAECVRTRKLGSKQSQPIHFSTDRDRKRVFKFLETYGSGDLNTAMVRALRYYYRNRFVSPEDHKIVDEFIDKTKAANVGIPSRRKGLEEKPTTAAAPSATPARGAPAASVPATPTAAPGLAAAVPATGTAATPATPMTPLTGTKPGAPVAAAVTAKPSPVAPATATPSTKYW